MSIFFNNQKKKKKKVDLQETREDHFRAQWHPGHTYSVLPWELPPLTAKELDTIQEEREYHLISSLVEGGIQYYFFKKRRTK